MGKKSDFFAGVGLGTEPDWASPLIIDTPSREKLDFDIMFGMILSSDDEEDHNPTMFANIFNDKEESEYESESDEDQMNLDESAPNLFWGADADDVNDLAADACFLLQPELNIDPPVGIVKGDLSGQVFALNPV